MAANDERNRELFLELLQCEREKDVKNVLEKYGMEHEEDWIPYGDMEGNYSIIGTQASNPEKAFSEKITNAIDALLMRKCQERGIDPRGDDAPGSPQEALKIFYNIENGDPARITEQQEKEIQDEICIWATSPENKIMNELRFEDRQMNMMIWDQGEGQTPDGLQKTVLSLIRGNKQGIAFTQGCFNQGGSGALKYCGNHGYCLVISRRHPSIRKADEDDRWGFTLIREEMRSGDINPVYTYYAPGGKVPALDVETLPLLPRVIAGQEAREYLDYDRSCSVGIPYQKEVNCGTLLKMYNYDMKNKGPLASHIKFELAKVLYDTYLPIRMIDCRKNKFNNNMIFRGLQKFLDDDLKKTGKDELIHRGFPIRNYFTVEGQQVEMTVYGFNRRKGGAKSEKDYMDDNQPILFVVGQQVQGKMDSRVISNAGFSPIKNSLLIILKFPNIDPMFRKDLFMTDRERLLEKRPKKGIQEKIREFLQNEPLIQSFCDERMQWNIQNDGQDHQVAEKIVEKLFTQNSGIKNLLFPGGKISGTVTERKRDRQPQKKNIKNEEAQPDLLENPTYFIPALKIRDGHYIREAEVGKSFRISMETDGPEDFFSRLENPGKLRICYNGRELSDYSLTELPGRINLIFGKSYAKRIGTYDMEIYISCEGLLATICHKIELIVKEADTSNEEKMTRDKKESFMLPELHRVRKEQWDGEMDEDTALILQHYQGKSVYKANLDNVNLRKVIAACGAQAVQTYYEECFCYDLLFMAICLENDLKEKGKEINEIEERVRMSTEDYAKAFWPIEQISNNMRKAMLGE